MMETPICDFAERYRNGQPLRLHMPGHKGNGVLGVEALDITEIEGADVLYHASGIIRQSEENAAKLFDTARTVYSAEGSSLCIRAMLRLAMLYGNINGEKKPVIAAVRNAHKVFLTAAALLDVDIQWLTSGHGVDLLSNRLTPAELEAELTAMPHKPTAVYVTSPDYPGHIADVKGIAEVCHRHSILLLVDNAHGAYLRFLSPSLHPITEGADICCDSAHKTLPVLTGGAYLHISRSAPEALCAAADEAMALFASTSPSYLILQSLDAANRYLTQDYAERLNRFAKRMNRLKATLTQHGYELTGEEPLKLTLMPKSYGYTGCELANYLMKERMVCEYADPDYTVLMLTPETEPHLPGLEQILMNLPKRQAIRTAPPFPGTPERVLSPREALFSPHRKVPVREAEGRILGAPNVSCPPAIPILACGERITKAAVETFLYYGITECDVVEAEQ